MSSRTRMPRSPADATRFTATGPHANAKATTIDLGAAPPPNESPAQKVARLREAARRAKIEQLTTWEKVVINGRVWADRAHKVTATSLIALSVIAAGFAALSIGDMMISNRGKKANWIKVQQENYDRALALAREAQKNGTLTDDLAMFLFKEHAIEQAEAEAKNRGSIFQRAKESLFGGLTKEETAGGKLASMLTKEDLKRRVSNEDMARLAPATAQAASDLLDPIPALSVTNTKATARPSQDPSVAYNRSNPVADQDLLRQNLPTVQGGYLDRLAGNAASAILTSANGWTSFRKSN